MFPKYQTFCNIQELSPKASFQFMVFVEIKREIPSAIICQKCFKKVSVSKFLFRDIFSNLET